MSNYGPSGRQLEVLCQSKKHRSDKTALRSKSDGDLSNKFCFREAERKQFMNDQTVEEGQSLRFVRTVDLMFGFSQGTWIA